MEYNGGQDFNGLQHFTYNNSRFVDLLFGHLEDTDFDGITVWMSSIITSSYLSITVDRDIFAGKIFRL